MSLLTTVQVGHAVITPVFCVSAEAPVAAHCQSASSPYFSLFARQIQQPLMTAVGGLLPTRQKKLCSINLAGAHLSTSQVQMDHYTNGAKRTKHMFSCHLYKTLREPITANPPSPYRIVISRRFARADWKDQAVINVKNGYNDLHPQKLSKPVLLLIQEWCVWQPCQMW